MRKVGFVACCVVAVSFLMPKSILATDDSRSLGDMENAAQAAEKLNPDQGLGLAVDEIYRMRDAAANGQLSTDEIEQREAAPLPQANAVGPEQQTEPYPLPALRRSSSGLFQHDHFSTGTENGDQSNTPRQSRLKETALTTELASGAETTGSNVGAEVHHLFVLREDRNNNTKNETEEKRKEEDRKREEEEKKRKDKERQEDAAKVRLGIEIASETEREGIILRCIDGGPSIEAKDVKAPNVSVGLYVLNLEADSGLTSGQFFADFLLFLRQEDKPMKGDNPMSSLAFTNAKSIDSMQDYGAGVQRVSGSFFFSPDLRMYPFDHQTLEVVLEQFRKPIAEFQFQPDYHLNGISPSLRFPGWAASLRYGDSEHANCRVEAGFKVYPGASLDSAESAANVSFSRFRFKLGVQRPIVQGFMTHFIPPMIMLTPTVFSYTLDALQHVAMRFSIAGGGLISIILFQTSIDSALPPFEYMCVFDKYVFCVYFAVFCGLVHAASVAVLFRKEAQDPNNAALRERLHTVSIRAMVLSTVVIFGVLFPIWVSLGTSSSWVVLVLCVLYLIFLFLQCYAVRRGQDAFLNEGFVSLGESQQP